MPGRVEYVGPDAGGHRYTDGASSWVVPGAVPQQTEPTLPSAYEDEMLRGLRLLQQQTPEVQDFERGRYNELAQASRETNAVAQPLPDDHRAQTQVRFPQAASFQSLPEQRLLGPTEAGPSLSDRPPVDVRVQYRRPDDTEAQHHEGLHVGALDPAQAGGRVQQEYYSMGPRGREQFRVAAAIKHDEDPHRVHALERAERAEKFMTDLQKKLGL